MLRDIAVTALLWLGILSAFNVGHSQIQKLVFEHITVADGLSQNTPAVIYQDKRGFVWIGTQDGLNKYDGYAFEIYRHDPLDSNTLSDNFIKSIHEDNRGHIWVGTLQGGLCRLDPVTGRIIRFQSDPQNPRTVNHPTVRCLARDSQGTIWAGTDNGLARIDARSSAIKRYFLPGQHAYSNLVLSILPYGPGELLVGTFFGELLLFSTEDGGCREFGPSEIRDPSRNGLVQTMIRDRQGVLWIGTGSGLVTFDEFSHEVRRYSSGRGPQNITTDYISTICEDQRGYIWVGTGAGLNIFDRNTRAFQQLWYHPNQPDGISGNRVFAVHESSEGVVWVGVGGQGIDKYNHRKHQFTHIRNKPSRPYILYGNFVSSFEEDRDGNIWIGTQSGGLNRLRYAGPDGQRRKSVYGSTYELKSFFHLEDDNSISDNYVQNILEDNSGNLWIGTLNGLDHYDQKTNRFLHFKHDADDKASISSNFIRALFIDSQGLLWVGTGDGLNRLEEKSGTFKRYLLGESIPNSTVNVVFSIGQRGDEIWVGSQTGVYSLSRANGRISRHRLQTAPGQFLDTRVRIILPQDDAVWVGSDHGLFRYNPLDGSCDYISTSDGLPNNVIYGIVPDEHGNLWISTNRGISRFTPARGQKRARFRNFTPDNGLQSYEYNTCAYFRSSAGEIYFGGVNGFNVFHPDSIKDNPHVPRVSLTDMKVNNISVGLRPTSSNIELPYNENYLSFEFVALDFSNPRNNRYMYLLEGLDRQWIDAGTRRFASYADLKPGSYIFRVRGANADGVWNENGQQLPFVILPPWWQTWWFRTLAGLTVFSVLVLLFRFQQSRSRAQKIRLRELVQARTSELQRQKEVAEHSNHIIRKQATRLKQNEKIKSRFFANISHEFRTPLTLILGPLPEMISNGYDSRTKTILRSIQNNGQRLLKLINQLLDLSRLESGNLVLKPQPGNLDKFLREIVNSFNALAERKSLSVSFVTDMDHTILEYDVDKLEKVFTNLMSNACKFTHAGGRVDFRVKAKPAGPNMFTVSVVVRDNGPGIQDEDKGHIFDRFYQGDNTDNREYEGTGIGLALTKELVELHGGTISLRSESGKGSEFEVLLNLRATAIEEVLPDSSTSKSLEPAIVPGTVSRNSKRSTRARAASRGIVLIIEDNAELSEFLAESFKADYVVKTAPDGQAGVEQALEIIPDLVICDVMMPKMDGYEVCRRLREDTRTDHIPLVLLTARASVESKLTGLRTGADDYVSKPFNVTELQERVNNLITQRRRLRNKYQRVLRGDDGSGGQNPWLRKVEGIVEDHIEDPDFDVSVFAREAAMSRSQLHRKIKSMTGYSPSRFIRIVKLKRAHALLLSKSGSISEIAFGVGFNNLSYFSKCFSEEYGRLPSELNVGRG